MACLDCRRVATASEDALAELARVRRAESQLRIGLAAAQEALAIARGEIQELRVAVETSKEQVTVLGERLAFIGSLMEML